MQLNNYKYNAVWLVTFLIKNVQPILGQEN